MEFKNQPNLDELSIVQAARDEYLRRLSEVTAQLLQRIKEVTDYRTALRDIALCRIPNVPDGATVTVEHYALFARERATAALEHREHGAT